MPRSATSTLSCYSVSDPEIVQNHVCTAQAPQPLLQPLQDPGDSWRFPEEALNSDTLSSGLGSELQLLLAGSAQGRHLQAEPDFPPWYCLQVAELTPHWLQEPWNPPCTHLKTAGEGCHPELGH